MPRLRRPRARAGDAHASASSAWPACASATCAAPPALIDEVDKVRPPYNVSVLNAEATLFALEHADVFARQAATLRAERGRAARGAGRAAGRAAVSQRGQHDPGARAGRRSARSTALKRARRAGEERRQACTRCWPNCLRLTVGTPDENDALLAGAERACDHPARTRMTTAPPKSARHHGNADPRARRPRRQRRRAALPPASASSTTCSTRSPATA